MRHFPLSRICSTPGCPAGSEAEWHRCFVCGREPIDHQHYPKKSLAGKQAKIVAALCRRHHDLIDKHKWSEFVYNHGDGTIHYNVKDLKGMDRCDKVIGKWRVIDEGGGRAADGNLGWIKRELSPVPGDTAKTDDATHGASKVADKKLGISVPAPLSDHPQETAAAVAQDWPVTREPHGLLKGKTLPAPVSTVEEHSTYLTLPEGLPYAEWEKIGKTLWQMHKAWQWWFADWWAYGERVYGELASQALAADANYQTLANALWVGRQFEPSRRRETLSFKHHSEVASLEPDKQDELLDRAEAEHLSTRELREIVKGAKPECEHDFVMITTVSMTCSKCGKVQ